MKRLFIFSLLSLSFFACKNVEKEEQNYLIILSMDGMRWDYPDLYATPTLDTIENIGVRAAIQPSFPTKTFPNHYTMATGLYPSNSGLVANVFYNPELDRVYRISDRSTVEDPRFYKGEPFWVSAELQGLRSASYFWVGSETKIKGLQPSIWKKYDGSVKPIQMVDSVISWLQRPEAERPHLISFYFYEPDMVGHHFGPLSAETKAKVEQLDSVLAYFYAELKTLDIADKINVMITSDHGMGAISEDKKVILSDYLDDDDLEYCLGSNPHYLVQPKAEKYEKVYSQLKAVEGITVWKKDEVPERLHYSANPSIADLIVTADSAWSVYDKARESYGKGTHGYDNANEDMQAIFYAFGPAFKSGYKQAVFPNVDLYPLMMEVLDLEAAEMDGQLERVKGMLKE